MAFARARCPISALASSFHDMLSCCPRGLLGCVVGCSTWATTNIHPTVTRSVPSSHCCAWLNNRAIPTCPAVPLCSPDQPIAVFGSTAMFRPDNMLNHANVLNSAAALCHLDLPSGPLPRSAALIPCPRPPAALCPDAVPGPATMLCSPGLPHL